jgi:hypothetical protein
MDARQGREALRAHAGRRSAVAPREAIPIRYGDYTLLKSPLSDFERAAADARLPTQIRYLARGESYRWASRAREPTPAAPNNNRHSSPVTASSIANIAPGPWWAGPPGRW